MKLNMNFISSAKLNGKSEEKKIDFVLNKVKDGSILVLDGVMKPEQEMALIKETMRRVDDGFPGIEVCSLEKPMNGFTQFFEFLTERGEKVRNFFLTMAGEEPRTKLKTGITLIGPAKIIKKIKKNPDSFSVLAEL